MDTLDRVLVVLMIMGSSVLAGTVSYYAIIERINSGEVGDYHCQPITTHNTLEDAKAQVERYQERVK